MTFLSCIKAGVFSVILLVTISLRAQNSLGNVMTMGFGDVAEIKKRAEAGDAQAQVTLGKGLVSYLKSAEALGWFRKAAAQGNADGEYEVGNMLLYGSPVERVESLQWTFLAATHGQASAM